MTNLHVDRRRRVGSGALFILWSFEGPDRYSLAGGLGTRMTELSETLAQLGYETHLFFIGDPDLPGHEVSPDGKLHLHRWCQWISDHHRSGVYDNEEAKVTDFAASAPDWCLRVLIGPAILAGRPIVVLAEEWHTAPAMIRIAEQLRERDFDHRVLRLWNVNNTFGLDRVDWAALTRGSVVTTVSRYMKHLLRWHYGASALVVPNGIPRREIRTVPARTIKRLRDAVEERPLLVKMARWDPNKRWLQSIEALARLKDLGLRPLLFARGGSPNDPHEQDIRTRAETLGLRVTDVESDETHEHIDGLLYAIAAAQGEADILNWRSFVSEGPRQLLFAGADAVLANSGHEPFGLVGLEVMAVGGLAIVGASGEDYANYQNAIAIETEDPAEVVEAVLFVLRNPAEVRELRRVARHTAQQYTWDEIVWKNLAPKLELLALPSRAR